MNTNTLTSGCSAGRLTWHEGFIPASEGGFQGYSRVHGLLPYPEATVPIKMHLLEDHEIGKYILCWLRPFGRTGG